MTEPQQYKADLVVKTIKSLGGTVVGIVKDETTGLPLLVFDGVSLSDLREALRKIDPSMELVKE